MNAHAPSNPRACRWPSRLHHRSRRAATLLVAWALACVPLLELLGCATEPRSKPRALQGSQKAEVSGSVPPAEIIRLEDEQLPDADAAFALVKEARSRREASEPEAALALLDKALQTDPGLGLAHLEWALTAQFLDLDRPAIEGHLARAITLDPASSRAHVLMADFLLTEDPSRAATFALRAQELRPDSLSAGQALARAQLLAGQPSQSCLSYRKVLLIDNRNVPATLGLAAAAEASGDLPAARSAYLRVVNLEPQSVGHRRRLIAFLVRSGDEAAAKKQRRLLSKLDPVPKRKLRKLRRSKRDRRKAKH